jgi:hypothetical protein
MQYDMGMSLFPAAGQTFESPGYAAATKDLFRQFECRFGAKLTDLAAKRFPNLPPEPYIDGINFLATDKSLLLDIYQWIKKGADGAAKGVGEIRVGIAIADAKNEQTVARARWVELLVDFKDISQAKYEHICPECQSADADRVPDPFPVNGKFFKKPAEMYFVHNATYVVSQKILGLFEQMAADQFDSGSVVVSGRADLEDKYSWIRPRAYLKGRAIWFGQDPCPKCHVPRDWDRRLDDYPDQPQLLPTFGSKELNFARIQRFARRLKTLPVPPNSAIVSGGLYSALRNNGVKGIEFPPEIYISVLPDTKEPTLEPEPRFAHLVGKPAEKGSPFRA